MKYKLTQIEREQMIERQRAEERRLRKMALEQFSVSWMNSTKWRKLIASHHGLKIPGFRIKFIDDDKVWDVKWLISPASSYIEGGAFGPVLFVAVEWLEILFANTSAVETDRNELRRRLQEHNVPFTEEGYGFRVVGYQS